MRTVSPCTDRVCAIYPPPNIPSSIQPGQRQRLGWHAIQSHIQLLMLGNTEADEAYVIGKRGQYTPVGAYLAGDEIIKIAVEHGAQMIHPGRTDPIT